VLVAPGPALVAGAGAIQVVSAGASAGAGAAVVLASWGTEKFQL